jgi:tetratricopeptide (TPR) repeat protein
MATSNRQLVHGLFLVILFLVAMGTASPGASLASTQAISDPPKVVDAPKGSTQTSEKTDPAGKKTDQNAKNGEQAAAQGSTKDGNKGNAPAGNPGAIFPKGGSLSQNQQLQQLPEDTWWESLGRRWKEVKGLIKALLQSPKDLLTWSLVVLMALIMFRKSIRHAIEEMVGAIVERGGSIDAGGGIKFQIAERAIETLGEQRMPFTIQFEIEAGISGDLKPGFGGIEPQYKFPVSDAVGKYWSKKNGGQPEQDVTLAYAKLREKCQMTGSTFSGVRNDLLTYCKTLEAGRYLKADEFTKLLNEYQMLKEGCKSLKPTNLAGDADNFLIRRCGGVAFAQNEQWDEAKALVADIVWDQSAPHYLPAAAIWVTSEYHSLVKTTWPDGPDPSADSPQFVSKVGKIYRQGRAILEDMTTAKWGQFKNLSSPLGYYRRELLTVIGSIAGILGDLSEGADRDEFLGFSETALKECIGQVGNDGPTPFDHNNLADLYRQRGKFEEAKQEIDQAISGLFPDKDPMFYNTKAMIFWGQEEKDKKGKEEDKRNFVQAILILEEYGETNAMDSRTSQADVLQYVDNKILAAKLAVSRGAAASVHDWALAANKLEDACRFSETIKTARNGTGLRVKAYDMLGFAYMQQPGSESRAQEMFEKAVASLGDATESVGGTWQRRVNVTKVLTRIARIQRKTFSSLVAVRQRDLAETELGEIDAKLTQLGLEREKKLSERKFNCKIRLDTLIALHDLAEESFCEDDLKKARKHLDKVTPLLLHLKQYLTGDEGLRKALGNDVVREMESQISLLDQKVNFLLARLSIRDDRTLSGEKLISEVQGYLNLARGGNPILRCGADLVLGELFLTLALVGKGDAEFLYKQAITCLELAATHSVPSLTTETLRALAEAYSKRPLVMKMAQRKSSSSAKTP